MTAEWKTNPGALRDVATGKTALIDSRYRSNPFVKAKKAIS
jgi:hypothetical protein